MQKVHRKFAKINPLLRLFRDPISEIPRRHTPLRIANTLRLQLSRRLRRPRCWGYPYTILIEPTNACNLRCPLCPTGMGIMTRKVGMMDFSNFTSLVDEMAPYLYVVNLANLGEPLLHPRIFDMIEYLAYKNVSPIISTNAHFINPENIPNIVQSGLEKLEISIDGVSQQTYSKYHRRGDFNQVMENISALCSAKRGKATPHIALGFILMRHNESEVAEFFRLAEGVGADSVYLVQVSIPHYRQWTLDEAREYLPQNLEYSRFREGAWGVELAKPRPPGYPCVWAFTRTVVNWDGRVAPCCVDYDNIHDFGNAFREGLKNIWNNDKYVAFRRKLLAELNQTPVCSNCSANIY